MSQRLFLFAAALGLLCVPAMASVNVLFPVDARRAELKKEAFSPARAACEARNIVLKEAPKPVEGLNFTNAYGSDTRAEAFSWYVMVQAGRALAGSPEAAAKLRQVLMTWAKSDALAKSDVAHDTYYAMKRLMLPTIVAFGIVHDDMKADEQKAVHAWIDRIVRKLDKHFGGDVDHNNHRYLADATLMAWGAFDGDAALYNKGVARYREALEQMRPDGGLPLELRRGARAQWYMRQSLANLTVMAEIAQLQDDDLYSRRVDGKDFELMMASYLNGVENPLTILPDAAANYIPGPEQDFFNPDFGMLETRPHGRHYMAFAEAYMRHRAAEFNAMRLATLMKKHIAGQRPLIDEFSGGNATCFWWQPT
jgi:poly(beta-D-mannuronate) lyase